MNKSNTTRNASVEGINIHKVLVLDKKQKATMSERSSGFSGLLAINKMIYIPSRLTQQSWSW